MVGGDPWINLDGRLNAPVGTVQHPHLLDLSSATQEFGMTYVTRPPWRVSGVDYPVGVNSNVTLQDPLPGGSSLAAALVALGGSTSGSPIDTIIFGSGLNNGTLNAWDFSLHNGLRVELIGVSGATIQNCNWKVGSNNQQPLIIDDACTNCTLKYCVLDGGGNTTTGFTGASTAGIMDSNCHGTFTVQYNWFKHAPAEGLRTANSVNGTTALDLRFNIIEDCGTASVGSGGAIHGDMIQSFSASGQGDCTLWQADFNLWLQTQASTIAGAQGLSCYTANVGSQLSPSVVRSIRQANNTLIAPTGTNMSPMLMVDTCWLNGSAFVDSNYIDPTGCAGGAAAAVDIGLINGGTDGPGGNGVVTGTSTGNHGTNMLTGASIP